MSSTTPGGSAVAPDDTPITTDSLIVNPYLRQRGAEVENILNGRTVGGETPAGRALNALRGGGRFRIGPSDLDGPVLSALSDGGFLLPGAANIFALSNLKYISLETNSICNQRCFFCPVSTNPLPLREMPVETVDDLARQARGFPNFVAFFLNHYNEPFVDKRSPAILETLRRHGHRIAVNSNGSIGLDRLDGEIPAGAIDLLTINLHTVDRETYRQERGRDHLEAVLANVAGYREAGIAKEMRVVVLGFGDGRHEANVAAVEAHFAGTGISVMRHGLGERCGAIELAEADGVIEGPKILAGCEQTGSRVLEHLHILADGRAIICCEDYDTEEVVGDVHRQSLEDILAGEPMQALRRTIYGFDEASADFICSRCEYALCGSRLRSLD